MLNQILSRHDRIVGGLKKMAEAAGLEAVVEPHLRTSKGLRKPDLVIRKADSAIVVDAQVTGDSSDLDINHRDKVRKYDKDAVKEAVKSRFGVRHVAITSATLSWRGIWAPASAKGLRELGVTGKDLSLLAVRAL